MTRFLSALICLALASAGAKALDVETTAGGLASAVTEPATVRELRVTGSVDASDLHFVATEMDALEVLDLGGATVSAYSGDPILKIHHFEADVLPPMVLAGSHISEITLPAGIKAIGEFALAGTRLRTITIPASLQSTGTAAFAGCTDLESATVNCTQVADGAFASCRALRTVSLAAGSAIGNDAFADCTALAQVDGTEGITAIGNDAFQGCTALTEFAFGPELRSVGDRAFSGSGLKAADLKDCAELKSVGAAAFSGCPALAALSLPEGCDIAGARALAMGNAALAATMMPGREIPDYALASDAAIKTISLPEGLEYIGDHAMAGMTGLSSIDVTALGSVPELGEEVWLDVDQSAVRLKTDKSMTEAFRSAGQWQDFDISGSSTSEEITMEAAGRISARFIGATLQVRCTLPGVSHITVADTEGRVLATMVPGSDGLAETDTEPWETDIFMLSAHGGAGERAILKIARKR